MAQIVMLRRCLATALLLLIALPAQAQESAPLTLNTPIVADVSQNTVEIHSSFNGMQLLVFGARNQPGDLVIAVRGPQANLLLRRKERIAGMWMHVEQQKYADVPLFYAIASTRDLAHITTPATLAALGLGPQAVIRLKNPDSKDNFDNALMRLFQKRRTWQIPFSTITYFGESLFKAKLNLPDTLTPGDFTVEVFLFDRGNLVSAQMLPLSSFKTGFDATVFKAAQDHSILYGIGCILLALSGGWLAHQLFNRRK